MNFKPTILIASLSAFVLLGTFTIALGQNGDSKMSSESALLKPWVGPYGGVPPWRQVKTSEFVGAFDAAIEMATKEMEAIANNTEEPTFENTILAMEKSGETLDNLQSIFGVYSSNFEYGRHP